ncbi:hypothetical protein HN51_061193 [Arachis hypogaea]|nr:protein NETWORKED 4A isoform X2 [Arachis ipaensis]XP_020971265.1 protein NETWORKED 4A isoform X1 [Arachis ipaensis]XP_025626375.1 protein NETWORKED 4A-like [Arachis hypogaea]
MTFKKLKKRCTLTSEMEHNVKRMLQLIEDGGDSFAQKAEMYYQKRPELIALVEEFYRGYKSLAERYDHDVQSCHSDNGSESHAPMNPRRGSSYRAPGFDFFLGSSNAVNNSNCFYDAIHKDGDGSSTLTDSDDESSDNSSVQSFNSGFYSGSGSDSGMNRRILEVEMDLPRDEQELRNVNERFRVYEEEIYKLKVELEKYRSMELMNNLHNNNNNVNESLSPTLQISLLKDQISVATKESEFWKVKFNSEKRERVKLKEKMAEKSQLESELRRVLDEQIQLEEEIKKMECEMELLNGEIKGRERNIEELNGEICALKELVVSKDVEIKKMVEENERLKDEIIEGGEEKREAIRQLCFSLEHYRNGYNDLRQAFIRHKRFPVLAS